MGEIENLAVSQPDKVSYLDRLIEDYLASASTDVPQPNPRFDPQNYNLDRIGIQPVGGENFPTGQSLIES